MPLDTGAFADKAEAGHAFALMELPCRRQQLEPLRTRITCVGIPGIWI